MAWGGLEGFTRFYFTLQLSTILFAPLYPAVYSLTEIVLLIVPSFLWIDTSVAEILYWGRWESLVKALHSQVMWRRKQESISAGVLLSCSFPDTSCGARAGSSLWLHGAVFAYYLGVSHFISSQNCLAHVRAHLFLSGVSSWHAEMLPPALLCLHRTFGRRSGTSSLHRVLRLPAEYNKVVVWLGIQTSIFGSIFVGRSIIFADNLSSGQNLSISLPRLIDDFLELALRSRLLSTASSRGPARAAWAVNSGLCTQAAQELQHANILWLFFPSHYV